MSDHRFKVGSRVSLSSKNRSVGTSEFKVVRLLPPEGDDFQYCIKSAGEVIERVVKEYELKPYGI